MSSLMETFSRFPFYVPFWKIIIEVCPVLLNSYKSSNFYGLSSKKTKTIDIMLSWSCIFYYREIWLLIYHLEWFALKIQENKINMYLSLLARTFVPLCLLISGIHMSLTHFISLVSFYTPWKYQKMRGFLIFSGGIERDSGMI